MNMNNGQQDPYPRFGGKDMGREDDIWPFRQNEPWPSQPAAGEEAATEDARRRAASVIAEALLQAEEMVQGPSREVDRRMVEEAVSGLRSLGEYLERCVDSLTAERQQIESELQSLRNLVEELSGTVNSLRSGAMPSPAQYAPPMTELPEMAPMPWQEEPVPPPAPEPPPPPPPPMFEAGTPVSVQVHEVSNFNLLVRIERVLSGHPAVQSAGIESYQEEQARFVLTLREPQSGEAIQQALEGGLEQEVIVEKVDPEWNELVLRLKKDAPAGDPWGQSSPERSTPWS